MIIEINSLRFKTEPADNNYGCKGCCFFDDRGCIMPAEVAGELGSFCAIASLIFKDITNEKPKNHKVQ